MLTQQDVATTLGNAVRAGAGEGKSCFWATSVDKGTSVYLTVNKPAANHCALIRASLPKEGTQEDVPNLGSSALWNFQQVSLLLQGNLVACWPESVVHVTISGETTAMALRNVAAALAVKAHGNL